MITPDTCFALNCAEASLNQIGHLTETASPFSRRTTQGPVVTSFGPLPKLPLQDCADAQRLRCNQFRQDRPKLTSRNWNSCFLSVP